MPKKDPIKNIETPGADPDCLPGTKKHTEKDAPTTTWTEAAEEIEKELDADEPITDVAVKDLRNHAAG